MSGQARDYRQSQLFGGPDTRPALQRAEDDVGALVAGNFAIRDVFTSQTLTISDVGIVVSGFVTVTLQLLPVSGNTQKWFWIVNEQAQAVTIKAVGVELIDGANAFTLQAGDAITVWNDGQQWRVMGRIGVTSIAATGQPTLTGDVTLSAGANITLTQVGQDIEIAASGGSGTTITNALVISCAATAISWTVPVAITEFNGTKNYRTKFDLTNFTQARIVATDNGIPANNPVLAGQYSTDGGTTWAYLDGATGPSILLAVAGVNASGWVTLTGAAKADVQLRVVGSDVGGPQVSSFGTIYVEVK